MTQPNWMSITHAGIDTQRLRHVLRLDPKIVNEALSSTGNNSPISQAGRLRREELVAELESMDYAEAHGRLQELRMEEERESLDFDRELLRINIRRLAGSFRRTDMQSADETTTHLRYAK